MKRVTFRLRNGELRTHDYFPLLPTFGSKESGDDFLFAWGHFYIWRWGWQVTWLGNIQYRDGQAVPPCKYTLFSLKGRGK